MECLLLACLPLEIAFCFLNLPARRVRSGTPDGTQAQGRDR
jgi:hypothetical protein